MKLLFINQSRDKAPEKWLKAWVRALPAHLKKARQSVKIKSRRFAKLEGRELVVVFVNSGEMKRLNKLYRSKDYATDVLSFESADPATVGELVICPPVIRANSKSSGLSERGELGYMLVHGVLHLLGMDHMTKAEEIEMFALQDALYASLEDRVGLS